MKSLCVGLALVATTAFGQGAENPYLSQGKVFYQGFEYKKCVQRMDQVDQWKGVTPQQAAEAELYAGLCQFNLGKTKAAEGRFKKALTLDRNVKLPPYSSPKVEQRFNAIAATFPPADGAASTTTASATATATAKVETGTPTPSGAPTKLEEPDEPTLALAGSEKTEVKKPLGGSDSPTRSALTPVKRSSSDDDDDDEGDEAKAEQPEAVSSAVDMDLSPPGPPRWLAFGMAGGALAAVASSAYFGISAKGLEAEANAARFDSDAHRLADDARGRATAANVSIAAAGALATSALITFFLSPP